MSARCNPRALTYNTATHIYNDAHPPSIRHLVSWRSNDASCRHWNPRPLRLGSPRSRFPRKCHHRNPRPPSSLHHGINGRRRKPTLPLRPEPPDPRSRNFPHKLLRRSAHHSLIRPPRSNGRSAWPKVPNHRLRHPDVRSPPPPPTRKNPRRPPAVTHRRRPIFPRRLRQSLLLQQPPRHQNKRARPRSRAQRKIPRQATQLKRKVHLAGRTIGPPWTTDQKLATLAALLLLPLPKQPSKERQ